MHFWTLLSAFPDVARVQVMDVLAQHILPRSKSLSLGRRHSVSREDGTTFLQLEKEMGGGG